MRGDVPAIRLSRLTEITPAEAMALLNDPDIARHMPLAGDYFDEEATRKWLEAKDKQWQANGYGPWAVHANEEFAGWCGFQKDEGEADFALVLKKRFWGLGRRIYLKAVGKGFDELGYESIVVTLPPSRRSSRVLERLGFRLDGET
jgi:ribosomal-protein-alanine N-acetyltransferase